MTKPVMRSNEFISDREIREHPAFMAFIAMFPGCYRYDVNLGGWVDVAAGRRRPDGLIDPPLPGEIQ